MRGRRAQVLGERAEAAVVAHLTRAGWEARVNPNRRSIVDVIASKPRRQTRYLQVKASEAGTPPWPPDADIRRLAGVATRNQGIAVVAFAKPLVSRWQITYFSAMTGRQVDAD